MTASSSTTHESTLASSLAADPSALYDCLPTAWLSGTGVVQNRIASPPSPSASRALMRSRLVLIGALVLVAAAVAAMFIFRGGDDRPGGGRGPWPPQIEEIPETGSESPDAPDAVEAAAALQNLVDDPISLLPSDRRDELADSVREVVPEGSVVEADPSSWAPDGIGGGVLQVAVTAPGEPARSHLAVMAKEDGQWKVLMTLPLDG